MKQSDFWRWLLAIVAIWTLLFLTYIYFQLHTVSITRYTVPVKNLPAAFTGFTILHLSDLHSKTYGHNQQQLLAIINQEQFDLVALTGDLVDRHNQALEPTLDLVKGLSAKPMFYVTGNHDWQFTSRTKEPLESLGVQFLANRSVKFTKDSQHLWVLGVDDPYLKKARLDLALDGVKDTAPKILLAHAPDIFAPAAEAGIDLLLVGHTHAGQVRLPLIGAILIPGQGFFPQLDYGRFTAGNTTMIISSGLGESILPIRFYCPPEIVLITLEPAE